MYLLTVDVLNNEPVVVPCQTWGAMRALALAAVSQAAVVQVTAQWLGEDGEPQRATRVNPMFGGNG